MPTAILYASESVVEKEQDYLWGKSRRDYLRNLDPEPCEASVQITSIMNQATGNLKSEPPEAFQKKTFKRRSTLWQEKNPPGKPKMKPFRLDPRPYSQGFRRRVLHPVKRSISHEATPYQICSISWVKRLLSYPKKARIACSLGSQMTPYSSPAVANSNGLLLAWLEMYGTIW